MIVPWPVALFAATLVVETVLTAAAFGVAITATLRVFDLNPSPKIRILQFVAVFALLDVVWLPAIASSQLTLAVGNPEVATFLDMHEAILVASLYSFDLAALVTYFIEAGIAVWAGDRALPRSPTANLPNQPQQQTGSLSS